MTLDRSKLDPPRIKWLIEPTFDEFGHQMTAGIDDRGREFGSSQPVRPPVGLSVNQGGDELHAVIKRLFAEERSKFMAAVAAEEFETEDEANDFVVEDDLYPPGSEDWEGLFEFPDVPYTGKPKQVEVNQTSSSDLGVASSVVTKVEKPIVSSVAEALPDGSKGGSVGKVDSELPPSRLPKSA